MYADQIDNELRREIFLNLCKNQILAYSKLKPGGVESNQFAYHLKKLKDDGFVEKTKDGYTLALKGLRLADHLSFKTELIREQAKLIIVLVVFTKNGKKILVGERLKQPQINKLVFPSGKLHFGESVEVAAKRSVLEILPDLEHKVKKRGSAWLKFSKDGVCYSHLHADIFEVRLDELKHELLESDYSGHKLFWVDTDLTFDDKWTKGSKEIFDAVKAKEEFEVNLEYNE